MFATVRSVSVWSLRPVPKGSTATTRWPAESALISGWKSSAGAAVPNPGSSTMVSPPAPLTTTFINLPSTGTNWPYGAIPEASDLVAMALTVVVVASTSTGVATRTATAVRATRSGFGMDTCLRSVDRAPAVRMPLA